MLRYSIVLVFIFITMTIIVWHCFIFRIPLFATILSRYILFYYFSTPLVVVMCQAANKNL